MNSESDVAALNIRPAARSLFKAASCCVRNLSAGSSARRRRLCQSRNRWHSRDHAWTWPASISVMLLIKSSPAGYSCSGVTAELIIVLYVFSSQFAIPLVHHSIPPNKKARLTRASLARILSSFRNYWISNPFRPCHRVRPEPQLSSPSQGSRSRDIRSSATSRQ